MTVEEISSSVRSRWNEEISAPRGLVSQYDNADLSDPKPTDNVWCRVNVRIATPFQATLGLGRMFRYPGVLIVQIFAPKNTGTQATDELIDAINAAFRGISASGVVYRVPQPIVVGDKDGYWQTNVNCEFYADDVT